MLHQAGTLSMAGRSKSNKNIRFLAPQEACFAHSVTDDWTRGLHFPNRARNS